MIAPGEGERLSKDPLSKDQEELLGRVRSFLEKKLSTRVILSEREVSIEALHNYSVGSLIVLKDLDPKRLQLEVDGVPVAEGETVLVGDKLGLRIDRVIAPREILERLEMTAEKSSPREREPGDK